MLPYDEYGDVTHPTNLLLHGAMAVDTFSLQYDLLKELKGGWPFKLAVVMHVKA